MSSSNGKAVKKSKQMTKAQKPASKDKSKKKVKGNLSLSQLQREKFSLFRLISALTLNLSATSVKNNIPFNWTKFMKGTQYPTIRLYVTSKTITLVNSTDYTTVYSLQGSNLNNFSDLASVFDEYRVIDAEFQYFAIPNLTVTVMGKCLAVIDYGDTTALASYDAGSSFDTRKILSTKVDAVNPKPVPVTWKFEFEPLPDMEWVPTSTNGQVFGTWKPYFVHPAATSGDIGHIEGWADVQFRNSA